MKIAAVLPVALLLLTSCGPTPHGEPLKPLTEADLKSRDPALLDRHGWIVKTETEKMDGRPEVYLSKFAEEGRGSLVVRCSRGVTDVYVVTDHIVHSGNVRVKFDNEPPRRQNWSKAESGDALFSREGINLARKFVNTRKFLFEYRPFETTPETLEFNLAGLADHLDTVGTACNWAKIDAAKALAERNAKAAAELDHLRNARIREALAKYVEPCRETWLRETGRWCWYDASDSFFKDGGSPMETKEAALDDAVYMAKSGRVFVKQLAEIDHDLKP